MDLMVKCLRTDMGGHGFGEQKSRVLLMARDWTLIRLVDERVVFKYSTVCDEPFLTY